MVYLKLANFMLHLSPINGYIVSLCTYIYKSKQEVQFWKEWRINYPSHYACLICHQRVLFLFPETLLSNFKTGGACLFAMQNSVFLEVSMTACHQKLN